MGIPNDTTVATKPDFEALSNLDFAVFPLPRGKKTPNMSWKPFQSRHATPEEIAAWQGEDLNAAIVTGQISNVLALDIDSEEAQAIIDGLNLPATPTVRTKRGRHLLFRYPPFEVRNSVCISGHDLDVRGEGGYIVAPGSLHPEKAIYEWEISPEECDFAELPAEVLALIQEGNGPKSVACRATSTGKYLEAGNFTFWLNREINESLTALSEAKEGKRNDTLNEVAWELARHAAALEVDWIDIAAEIRPTALAVGLSSDEIETTLESAWKAGSEYPTEWLEVANQWLYVATPDRFCSPKTNQQLKPEAFSRQFADVKPQDSGKFAEFLTTAGLIDKVLDFRFEPAEPTGIITLNGERFFNTYRKPNIEAVEGDWSPLTDFLEYLVPDKFERDHLVQMMAWTIQNPGEKLSYALLLKSTEHGVGKSTLIEIWRHLLGFENTRMTNSEEMDSPYQSYLEGTLLVVLEELNLGSGISFYNRLKAMITSPTAIINVKYRPQREVPNHANFVFLSNLDVPVMLDQSDRRFFVIDTPAERRPSDYWSGFYSWWKANLGVVWAYFDNIAFVDFEPKGHPPMTTAKESLMLQSEAPLVQNLRELLIEMNYPLREVCKLDDVRYVLRKRGIRVDGPRKLESALKSLGCMPLGQSRLTHSKANLWALDRVGYWLNSSHEERRRAYEVSPLEEEAA